MPNKEIPSKNNTLQRIIDSQEPAMVLLKYLLILLLIIAGINNLWLAVQSLFPPDVFRKDFLQEYLLAKAAVNGINPYLPLPELAQYFFGTIPESIWPHPTPHPPPVAILCAPLAILHYQHAASVWLLFEILCIMISVYLILQWWMDRHSSLLWTGIVTIILFAWAPVYQGIILGQLMSLLTLLMILTWRCLRSDFQFLGGLFLGTSLALKFIGWPVVLFLILGKKWVAASAAVTVLIAWNAVAAMMIGLDSTFLYYREVGSIVEEIYRTNPSNFSIWSIGWRLGYKAGTLFTMSLFPFFLLIIMVSLGIIMAKKTSNMDYSLSILTCLSILANPIAWNFYLVLLLLPIAIVWKNFKMMNYSGIKCYFFFFLVLLLLIPSHISLKFINMIGINVPAIMVTLGMMFLAYQVDNALSRRISD